MIKLTFTINIFRELLLLPNVVYSNLHLFGNSRSGNLFPRPVTETPPQEQRQLLVRPRTRVAETRAEAALLGPADDGWNFAALCRGEELRHALPHVLTCSVRPRHAAPAWLRLGPPKQETQHQEPDILVYHDVMSPRELDQLKETATPTVQ